MPTTEQDDPRVKLMQKWSREMPNTGSRSSSRLSSRQDGGDNGSDDDEDVDNEDMQSEMSAFSKSSRVSKLSSKMALGVETGLPKKLTKTIYTTTHDPTHQEIHEQTTNKRPRKPRRRGKKATQTIVVTTPDGKTTHHPVNAGQHNQPAQNQAVVVRTQQPTHNPTHNHAVVVKQTNVPKVKRTVVYQPDKGFVVVTQENAMDIIKKSVVFLHELDPKAEAKIRSVAKMTDAVMASMGLSSTRYATADILDLINRLPAGSDHTEKYNEIREKILNAKMVVDKFKTTINEDKLDKKKERTGLTIGSLQWLHKARLHMQLIDVSTEAIKLKTLKELDSPDKKKAAMERAGVKSFYDYLMTLEHYKALKNARDKISSYVNSLNIAAQKMNENPKGSMTNDKDIMEAAKKYSSSKTSSAENAPPASTPATPRPSATVEDSFTEIDID